MQLPQSTVKCSLSDSQEHPNPPRGEFVTIEESTPNLMNTKSKDSHRSGKDMVVHLGEDPRVKNVKRLQRVAHANITQSLEHAQQRLELAIWVPNAAITNNPDNRRSKDKEPRCYSTNHNKDPLRRPAITLLNSDDILISGIDFPEAIPQIALNILPCFIVNEQFLPDAMDAVVRPRKRVFDVWLWSTTNQPKEW